MSSETMTNQATGSLIGKLGTWLMIIATIALAFVVVVEVINILFYDPWSDEKFLFKLSGMLSDVKIGPLTYIMFGSLAVLLMMGLPLAFVTGGLGVAFIYLVGDSMMLNIIPSRIFPMMTNSDLAAIPLFIFMASMLERAGLIEEMFNVVYKWMGGLGYDQKIALGSIMAGGTLGILIPPSILAILYAVVAQQSVGELYLGSVIPGLILAGLYVIYVGTRAWINPELGPPVPEEERIGLKEKLLLLKDLIAPLVLVFLVLGLLFGGVATPVEAAGIGSFGAILVAMKHKVFSVATLRDASVTTAKASAMVLWIMFGASVFVGFYILQGGQDFITETILGIGLSPYAVLLLLMVLLVVLGMFLDWVGILLLAVPIFIPIVEALEFPGLLGFPAVPGEDVVLWFGVLYLVNMQMSFLSPPFGYALFYIRGVCPPDITMGTIFKSSLVFLAIQAFGLFICVLIPGVVTWLPNLVYG